MISLVDLNIGNVGSVSRALLYLRIPHTLVRTAEDLLNAQKIILPGVGSFSSASAILKSSGLRDALIHKVMVERAPILGICLGMQLLSEIGHEGGINPGLGFIKAEVRKMGSRQIGLRLPHMGWNHLSSYNLRLLRGVNPGACFYFVHSYEVVPKEKLEYVTADYGTDVLAMLEKDNVFGCQFHPEKSQEPGLKILKNFWEL